MDEVDRLKEIVLYVSEIKTPMELQKTLKNELGFPDFYGMNWDAFWDAITGLVELPEKLVIDGWKNLVEILPEDAKILKELLEDFNNKYPCGKCLVQYS